jgi:hypothetical protein
MLSQHLLRTPEAGRHGEVERYAPYTPKAAVCVGLPSGSVIVAIARS